MGRYALVLGNERGLEVRDVGAWGEEVGSVKDESLGHEVDQRWVGCGRFVDSAEAAN